MSISRIFLAAIAAVVMANPVFAIPPVPAMGVVAPQTQSAEAAKINVNTATTQELMKVKGLNMFKARAIVSYRKKNGNFNSLDELTKIRGFTRLKGDDLKNLQDQLSVS